LLSLEAGNCGRSRYRGPGSPWGGEATVFSSSDFVVIGMSVLALAGFVWYAVLIVLRQGEPSGGPATSRRAGTTTDRER